MYILYITGNKLYIYISVPWIHDERELRLQQKITTLYLQKSPEKYATSNKYLKLNSRPW